MSINNLIHHIALGYYNEIISKIVETIQFLQATLVLGMAPFVKNMQLCKGQTKQGC